MGFHDLEMTSITGEPVGFDRYSGKLCLIVNVASQCGLTPQYADLWALHDAYSDRNFTVLGFPCNQFGAQEPGTDAEVLDFAQSKYDVTFPLFSKIEVNGDGACELYRWLTSEKADEAGKAEIAWNFTKFLVDGDGNVVARFAPPVTRDAIEAELSRYLQ